MKPPPPAVVRKGALAGGPDDRDVEAVGLAFLDLRFPDGHVERWLGPGRRGTVDTTEAGMARLQAWAAEAADMVAFEIACAVARRRFRRRVDTLATWCPRGTRRRWTCSDRRRCARLSASV